MDSLVSSSTIIQPDFSQSGCDYSHEAYWSQGGASRVVCEILKCPFNVLGNSPWCHHGDRRELPRHRCSSSLRDLCYAHGLGEKQIHEVDKVFALFRDVGKHLDITRRIPEVGSIFGQDHLAFNFHKSTHNRDIDRMLTEVQKNKDKMTPEESLAWDAIFNFARENCWGYSFTMDARRLFMESYWLPLFRLNEQRRKDIQKIIGLMP